MSRRRPVALAIVISLFGLVGGACSASGSEANDSGPTTSADASAVTTTEPSDEPEQDDPEDPGPQPDVPEPDDPEDPDDPADPGAEPVDSSQYSEALAAMLNQRDDLVWSDPDSIYCVAPLWIDAIGIDLLESEGVEPDDIVTEGMEVVQPYIFESVSPVMVDALETCEVDPAGFLVENWDAAGGYPADVGECISGEVGPEWMKTYLAATLDHSLTRYATDSELGVVFGNAHESCA